MAVRGPSNLKEAASSSEDVEARLGEIFAGGDSALIFSLKIIHF